MKILGLDISSSTIGYGLIDVSSEDNIILLKSGHFKPPDKKKSKDNFSLRLDFAYTCIKKLLKDLKPDIVVVEDYAKKFSAGRSSANTILVLASFNEVCCLSIYQHLKKEPIRIPVRTLRKIMSQHYDTDIDDKIDVLNFCMNTFKNFKPTKTKMDNYKKEFCDEADAIIVALGYYWSK